jgi:hypothetical protein
MLAEKLQFALPKCKMLLSSGWYSFFLFFNFCSILLYEYRVPSAVQVGVVCCCSCCIVVVGSIFGCCLLVSFYLLLLVVYIVWLILIIFILFSFLNDYVCFLFLSFPFFCNTWLSWAVDFVVWCLLLSVDCCFVFFLLIVEIFSLCLCFSYYLLLLWISLLFL